MTEKARSILVRLSVLGLSAFAVYLLVKNITAIRSIFFPFFIGIVIAYLANPAVSALERRGLRRLNAVIIVYTVFAGVVAAISFFILPALYREMLRFIDVLPFYAFRTKNYLDSVYIEFSKSLSPELKEAVRKNIDSIQELIVAQVNRANEIIFSMLEGLFNWIVALIISFYLLKDKDYFLGILRYMIPMKRRQEVYRIGSEINSALIGFIKGQLLVALLVGMLSTVGFLLIDLNFALLMGMITGVAEIIPYFGPIIGGIPVIGLGLMDSPSKALWAAVVLLVVQQLESGIISPKVVGDSVGIHPVFIILSLFMAARFWGVAGMFLAVPAAAIIKILAVYLFNKIVNAG